MQDVIPSTSLQIALPEVYFWQSVLFPFVVLSLFLSRSMPQLRVFSCWISIPTCFSFSFSCWDFLWVLTSSLGIVFNLVVWIWTCFSLLLLLFIMFCVLRWTSHCFSAAASNLSATSWLSRSLKYCSLQEWELYIQPTPQTPQNIFTWRWGSCSKDP